MGRILLIGFICLTGTLAMASTKFEQGNVERTKIPGEYIMSFHTADKVQTMSQFASSLNRAGLEFTSMESQGLAKIILSRPDGIGHKTLVLFKQINESSLKNISRSSQFIKVYPNYRYTGEMREVLREAKEDPKIDDQYHHELMGNNKIWNLLDTTNKIVVAVTDDGVALDHEDLKDNIYVNPGEIAGNGIDDDNNGYIDDVTGWNFVKDNNDPNPGSSWNDHGTHVAGIVAATKDNGVGIAGTAAPVAMIMPLRFAGGGGFTSDIVAETYRYATDNGAHIITTSYYIDGFVGDAVVEEAVRYGYDNGVIHFNSAGNGTKDSPKRKAFEELILVCNTKAAGTTTSDDVKSGSSNYGEGIDVCAPGDGGGGILSTLPNDKYGRMSGTSMASPNAAAVAALIWSQNPTWTRDQVVAQLLGTSDNIDAVNPKYVNKLGAGRVNSFRALNDIMPGPSLDRIKESRNGMTVDQGAQILSLRFDRRLDPQTVLPEHFVLTGPEGDLSVTIDKPYKMGSDYVVLNTGSLKPGNYTLSLDSNLTDPFGTSISGDKNLNFTVQ